MRDWLIGELSWLRLLKSVIFIYGAVAAYVYFRADAMIFQPQAPSYAPSTDLITIPVGPTESIAAIYLANPQAEWTILYNHGNAEDLGEIRPVLDQFRAWGYGVFAYDYRGYGRSVGNPSERNAYADGLAAYTYLTQTLGVPADQIILYGRSLGGGVAAQLATQVPSAGLVLESTFTSVFQVVLPWNVFPFDKFPTQARLSQIHVPILIIHGENDEIIPFAHGQRLYTQANAPKFFRSIPTASHNNVMIIAPDYIKQGLEQLTNAITQARATPATPQK